MDPRQVTMIVTVSLIAVVAMVKLLADAVIRWRELRSGSSTTHVERRLERIELALESIAVEIERSGEAQRFAARLLPPLPDVIPARPDGTPAVERWTLDRCGKAVRYRVRYTASPKDGDDFDIQLEK